MRIRKTVFLIGLLACPSLWAQEPAKLQPAADADTRPAARASVVAERRVWIQGIDRADVQQRMFEKALANPKPRAILGIDEAIAREITRFRVDEDYPTTMPGLFGGTQPVVAEHFVVRVQLSDANVDLPAKAEEFIDAVLDQFRSNLRQGWQSRPDIARAREAVDKARKELADTSAHIGQIHRRIAETTGGPVGATAAETRAAWARLDEERQTLEMELVGKRARQEALARAMEDLSNELAGRAAKDAVAEELEKVVEVREAEYKRAQSLFETKAASQQDVLEAQGKLAEARARVLERRDAVLDRNGGSILVDLNRELQSVVVSVAEAEARLKAATLRLERYGRLGDTAEALQRLETERERQVDALDRARTVLADTVQDNPAPELVIERPDDAPPGAE